MTLTFTEQFFFKGDKFYNQWFEGSIFISELRGINSMYVSGLHQTAAFDSKKANFSLAEPLPHSLPLKHFLFTTFIIRPARKH